MDSVRFVIEKKSKIVSDNTIQVEGLSDFFKNLCKEGLNVSKKTKKMAINVIKNPVRALNNTTNIVTATAARNLKKVTSALPELLTFSNTGNGLCLCKFV